MKTEHARNDIREAGGIKAIFDALLAAKDQLHITETMKLVCNLALSGIH